MLIVPLDEARPGMKLAAPVAHPDNPFQDLLRSGYELEDSVLDRMRSIGVPFIYVEYPALDSLDRHLAVQLSPARQEIYKKIKASITQVQKETRSCVSYSDYCSATRDLIEALLTQGQNPIYLDQMSRQGGDAVAHASAVAHLSLLLGLKSEQYLIDQRSRLPPNRAKDVVNLGVAGMMHDLGVSKLREELQQYSDADPPEDPIDRAEWETHAQIGYEMIRNDVEATAAASVYQHHQHFDGSGFPKRPNGGGDAAAMESEKIHVFARIIQCANLHDRLSSPVGKRPRRRNVEIYRLMQANYAGWCDPQIVRVLQMIAPPYPPGSRLRLTDGSRVIVKESNANAPLKPVVQRLAEDDWTPVGEAIDLRLPGAPAIEGSADAAAAMAA